MAASQTTTKTDSGKKLGKQTTTRRRYPRPSESSDSSDGSDRSADDVVLDKHEVWKRPSGEDSAALGYQGWATWTPGQWAWEFLRRNPKFHKACNDMTTNQASAERIAEKFHLTRFKDYREGYDNTSPLFARSIKVFPKREVFEDRLKKQEGGGAAPGPTKSYSPRDNEVVITFRLEPGTHVGTASLTKQLAQAKRKLSAYLSVLRKARSHGSGTKTIDSESLLKKLRTLDLSISKSSMAEIADVLQLVKVGRDLTPKKAQDRLTKVGSRFMGNARNLSSKGYMKLATSELPERV